MAQVGHGGESAVHGGVGQDDRLRPRQRAAQVDDRASGRRHRYAVARRDVLDWQCGHLDPQARVRRGSAARAAGQLDTSRWRAQQRQAVQPSRRGAARCCTVSAEQTGADSDRVQRTGIGFGFGGNEEVAGYVCAPP